MGARVYTSFKRKAWRVILEPPDMATEISVSFANGSRDAWAKVLERIRAARAARWVSGVAASAQLGLFGCSTSSISTR